MQSYTTHLQFWWRLEAEVDEFFTIAVRIVKLSLIAGEHFLALEARCRYLPPVIHSRTHPTANTTEANESKPFAR